MRLLWWRVRCALLPCSRARYDGFDDDPLRTCILAALTSLGLHQAAGGGDAVRRCVAIAEPQRPDGQLLERQQPPRGGQ